MCQGNTTHNKTVRKFNCIYAPCWVRHLAWRCLSQITYNVDDASNHGTKSQTLRMSCVYVLAALALAIQKHNHADYNEDDPVSCWTCTNIHTCKTSIMHSTQPYALNHVRWLTTSSKPVLQRQFRGKHWRNVLIDQLRRSLHPKCVCLFVHKIYVTTSINRSILFLNAIKCRS